MAKTIKEERLRWVLPIARREVRLADVVKVCPHGKRSLERWMTAYREGGEAALEPRSTKPKSHPRETEIRLKERIIEIRRRTKKCALKIKWQLAEEGLAVHERTVGKILKTENLTRKYRVRKVKYKYIRAERKPGELIEIDVKYVPGRIKNRRYFQYTAIDTASRWRHLAVYDEQSNHHSILFLASVMARFPHPIKAIKTDNGAIFTNRYLGANRRSDLTLKRLHPFDTFCGKNDITHYLIDPGKPAQNGCVERSHRSDQEIFYDRHTFRSFEDLQKKLHRWNTEYNDLHHCGLKGKSPNRFLADYKLINPPNVCA